MSKVAISALVIALVLAGCTPAPRTGSVGWEGTIFAGAEARDIPFTASDGTKTTFHKVRGPIAVIAFVSPPPDQCCWISPKLLNLVNEYRELPISVAEISAPQPKCPHGPGCMEMCRLGKTQLFAFCDSDRIAWKAYGNPKPGTVIVIDQRDRIVAVGSLDNLKPAADEAYRLGKRLHDQQPDIIYRNMYFK
jgi:hypothetical protein